MWGGAGGWAVGWCLQAICYFRACAILTVLPMQHQQNSSKATICQVVPDRSVRYRIGTLDDHLRCVTHEQYIELLFSPADIHLLLIELVSLDRGALGDVA